MTNNNYVRCKGSGYCHIPHCQYALEPDQISGYSTDDYEDAKYIKGYIKCSVDGIHRLRNKDRICENFRRVK